MHSPDHLTRPKYRPDIDGLRAIAILAVIFYHAFPGVLTGGFIGVDIFFVISGYLITSIIIASLERESFSFVEFYIRRINRIFPALFIVLGACFIYGWFFLLSDEYKQLGKHIAGGAGFISNLLYWNEFGYFDNAAETKPLLHLWSLGIEEQFYLLWPLLLWFAWKKKLNFLTITICIGIISFGLNVARINGHHAEAAFYSPQTRFWELMTGSLLAFMTLHGIQLFAKFKLKLDSWLGPIIYNHVPANTGQTLSNVQSLLGFFLIVAGLVVISRGNHFPGWWAILPTLGTLLVISAGAQSWFNRTVLSSRILVWFGLISFPLYLWHWPMLSFARIYERAVPPVSERIVILLVSILLAWLTYVVIEKRVRFKWQGKRISVVLLVLMFFAGGVGYYVYANEGLGFRLKDRAEFSEYFENTAPEMKLFKRIHEEYGNTANDQCNFYNMQQHYSGKYTAVPMSSIDPTCYERKPDIYKHAVFIWGDSHAAHLYFGLKKNLPPDWQILQVSSSMCVPNISVPGSSSVDYCAQSNWFAMKTIAETKPDVVIAAQERGHSIENFNLIADKLKSLGVKRVVFPGSTPHWSYELPKIILNELWINTPRRTYVGSDPGTFTANTALQAAFKDSDSMKFANLIDVLCNQEGCLTYIGDDKARGITAFDMGHFTPVASDYVAKNLLVKLVTEGF